MLRYIIIKSLLFFAFSAPLIPVGQPRIEKSMIISWEAASRNNSLDEEILYDVECFSCEKMKCNTSCREEQYDPGQNDLNQTTIVVSNLDSFGCYIFRIYPRNTLNNVIPKEKWKFYETSRSCILNERNVYLF